MGGAHPLSRDREELGPELIEPSPSASELVPAQEAPARLDQARRLDGAAALTRVHAPQPTLAVIVVVALILAGLVWAVIRGLHFYGLAPIKVAYDLDQPPLLLILVGGWLAYRSTRR